MLESGVTGYAGCLAENIGRNKATQFCYSFRNSHII